MFGETKYYGEEFSRCFMFQNEVSQSLYFVLASFEFIKIARWKSFWPVPCRWRFCTGTSSVSALFGIPRNSRSWSLVAWGGDRPVWFGPARGKFNTVEPSPILFGRFHSIENRSNPPRFQINRLIRNSRREKRKFRVNDNWVLDH